MNTVTSKTNHLPDSAHSALVQLTSALRAKGYAAAEIEELVLGAQEFIEARLAENAAADELDFSDIVANFSTPDLGPELEDKNEQSGVSGNIALGVSLVTLVLFVIVPLAVPEPKGGAAMLLVALVGAPAGAILGWFSRKKATGKVALLLSGLVLGLLAIFILIDQLG